MLEDRLEEDKCRAGMDRRVGRLAGQTSDLPVSSPGPPRCRHPPDGGEPPPDLHTKNLRDASEISYRLTAQACPTFGILADRFVINSFGRFD